jgi:hypothetical protein
MIKMIKSNNRMVILQISVRLKKKMNFIVYRRISITLAHKGPSGTNENIILKPASIAEQSVSIGSLPEKLEKFKELDFFYDLRYKALNDFWRKGGTNLKFDNGSIDSTIVKDINGTSDYKEFIDRFNGLELETVTGSKHTKKLVVAMLNKIKEPEFKESEEGELIYKAYREFLRNSNINFLELNGKFIYKEDTIQNIVLYLTLGCDCTIVDLTSLSKNILDILSCTYVQLDTAVISSDRITEIRNDLSESVTDNTNRTTNEIVRIEEANKSWFKKINSGLWKGLKWTLSGNKVVAGLQITLYTAGVGFAGKMALPVILGMLSKARFSDPKSLNVTDLDLPSTPGKDESTAVPDHDPDASATKLFAEFLLKLSKYYADKK